MNIRTLVLVLPATALLALAGCSGSQKSTREAPSTSGSTTQQQGMHGMQGGMAAMCPMQVQGTKVEASNTDTGAALSFTTQGDVTELRHRVSAMAQMHNEHHAGHGMHAQGGAAGCACGQHEGKDQGGSGCACGQHEGQGCHCGPHAGMMGMHMPASRVTTEEVPGGIRLVFTPEDASQLDALRESVRQHAEMMSSGHCPMMQSAPERGS